MKRKELTFTVKVITPTFMGGGFGQNDSIRPSEIKGLMRYWFRAVAGSIVGDDIKALKKLESLVFGSQERRSPFGIVIKYLKEYEEYKLDWNNLEKGVKYLGFVINMNKERLNNVIKAGSKFEVKFLFKNSVDERIIKLVAYSFYLATALGGFGLRARRGFGSWQIIDVRTEGIEEKTSKDFEHLKDYDLGKDKIHNIKGIIEGFKELIKNLTEITNLNRNYNFKTIDENFIYIHRLNSNNWQDVLDNLGNKYKNFRKIRINGVFVTPEYYNIRNFISNKCEWDKIRKNQWNFAFGLPIQINSREGIPNVLNVPPKRNKRGNIIPTTIGRFKVEHKNDYLERLPSTVWFSIKEKNNQYYAILTYLEGNLFPDENNDKIIFEFDKFLPLNRKCNNPPKSIEVQYNADELKDKVKSFLRGFNNVRRN
ncbi:MAG: type III-B CRISPR module RAMP protein Cmr1 [Persephonella sp.]|nr:MAG: type III-B CRISPR module RAMP protein Cmr1 [Persephonella sp.]